MSLYTVISKIAKLVIDVIYPPRCISCDTPLLGSKEHVLCASCYNKLEYFSDNSCWYCSSVLGLYATRQKECDECRSRERKFTRVVAVCEYNAVAKELIHSFKFKNHKSIYNLLSVLMANRFTEEYGDISFDYVVAVPLHRKKIAERGYNQAELIAQQLSNDLRITHASDLLIRVRNTTSQAMLTSEERESNLHGAFDITRNINGAKILLIDDVFTTGSTASQCAQTLRIAGAQRVYVLVFAR